MNPARPDHWRICLDCDQQQPRTAATLCVLCAGVVVKLSEHPKTLNPFLDEEREHLAWLEEPARSDWRSADEGTYYEPERLQRAVRLSRKKINDMEFVLNLASAVAMKGTP